MKTAKFRVMLTFLFAVLIISSCGSPDLSRERARRASRGEGDIVIGAAAPWSAKEDMLWQGIEMAADEINAGGGVLGRKVRIIKKDDEASVSRGRLIAQQFGDNLDVVAVIGHSHSYVSIPASRIYEFSGLLMLSPESTSPRLTQQGFKYVFRNVSSDTQVGKEMAEFAASRGFKHMVIYYIKNDYGRGLANAFEDRAGEVRITIADRLSYDAISNKEFRIALAKWKEFEFDAIFLAGSTPHGADFISEAREMGVTVPILGGDGLDSSQLWEIAGKAAEGVIVASHFHPDIPRSEVQDFVRAFQERYGLLPDVWAAQGYDAVKVLAHAMEKAGTTVPGKVAEVLHSTKDWPGVTGLHTFDENGNVIGKGIVKKKVQNRKFEYLE